MPLTHRASPPAIRTDLFDTTQWSLVSRARGSSADARSALEDLCRRYWYPVYAFVRRRVSNRDAAEDLTQGFFAHLLETQIIHTSDPVKGKFRSFLVTCCRHYLANQQEHARAAKRGGGRDPLPLDFGAADQRYRQGGGDGDPPEKVFDRQWGLAVLERAVERLEAEYATADRSDLFRRLLPHLLGARDVEGYSSIAVGAGTTEAAIKKAAQRLRERYRAILRDEVGATLARAADVDDEIRDLFAAFAQ